MIRSILSCIADTKSTPPTRGCHWTMHYQICRRCQLSKPPEEKAERSDGEVDVEGIECCNFLFGGRHGLEFNQSLTPVLHTEVPKHLLWFTKSRFPGSHD